MPVTTNYGWTMPTECGDVGTWDTILNTLFADIDTEVDRIEDMMHGEYFVLAATQSTTWVAAWAGADEARVIITSISINPDLRPLYIPLPMLRVGQKITGFSTLGYVGVGDAADASLVYFDETGAMMTVSAGHAITTNLGRDQTNGLAHNVATARYYAIRVNPTVAASGVNIYGGSVTVAAV